MNSEKCESGPDSSRGRASTIQVAAATALKELDQLRSAGFVKQEALDIESARIAHKKLRPEEHDLVVQRRRDDLARLLIKIRRGEARCDLAKKFLAGNNGTPPEPQL
jgi:hypothetical protein